MKLRIAGLISCMAVSAAVFATPSVAATTPHFAKAVATFSGKHLRVAFRESGLPANQPVTYELSGMRTSVYECADGTSTTTLIGAILDPTTGGPFGSTPYTLTLHPTVHSQSGTFVAQPIPAIQFIDGSGWGPITCNNGKPPKLNADQFFSEDGEPLEIIDTTHNVVAPLPGVFGICKPSPDYTCVS